MKSANARWLLAPVFAASATTTLGEQTARAEPPVSAALARLPRPTPLVGALAERLVPAERVHAGAAADLLVRELVSRACGEHPPAELAATCAPAAVSTLVTLRDTLARDLVRLPRAALVSRAKEAAVDRAWVTRAHLALTLLETLSETDSLATLGARLQASMSELPAATPAAELLRAAGLVVTRVASARDTLGEGVTPEDRRQRLLAAALDALAELERRSPEAAAFARTVEGRRGATRLLLESLDEEARARGALNHDHSLSAVAGLLVAWQRVLERSVSLLETTADAAGPPSSLAAGARQAEGALAALAELATLASALVAADPFRFARAVLGEHPLGEGLELVLDFIRAKTDAERRSVLAKKLFGLGAWSRPLLLDLSIGSLVVSGGGYRLAGEGLLGYNAERFGIAARGYSRAYDMSQGSVVDETIGGGGSLEGFAAFGEALRFDGRLVAGAELFDTDTTEGPPGVAFTSQTSIMARATLLAGVRYQSGSSAFGLWLGGGMDYEWYDPLVVTSDARVALTESEELKGQAQARLRVQLALLEGILVARLRADGAYYTITRSRVAIETGGGGVATVSQEAEQWRQLELRSRALVDLEIAKLFDIVPGVFAGFDLVARSGASGSTRALVPAFGLGVRRESF